MTNLAWRFCYLLGGACIPIGGPQHPGGTMEQMLHDPKWVPSHIWILAGFLALLAGLVFYHAAHLFPSGRADGFVSLRSAPRRWSSRWPFTPPRRWITRISSRAARRPC